MRTRIRDPALVEDLTQETFVKVTRQLQALLNPHRFALWLTRIAHGLRASRPAGAALMSTCSSRTY